MGIDVSKPYFDVSLIKVVAHVKQSMITERFDNTRAGMKGLHKWFKGQGVLFNENSLLVIENTGVYHRMLWAYCGQHNLPIHIGNGAHIKWSFGIARGKNDVIDSQRLCSYACKHADELKAAPVLDPAFLKLKDLLTARSKLVSQLQTIKKYLKELSLSNDASVQKLMAKAHKAALDGLKKSIAAIEDQLTNYSERRPPNQNELQLTCYHSRRRTSDRLIHHLLYKQLYYESQWQTVGLLCRSSAV